MSNKFLNIKIEGEDNIGVIQLGEIRELDGETENATKIRLITEHKMVEALQSHFACLVKVILVNVVSSSNPIKVQAVVIIESEEEDYQENVTMEETWLY